MSQRPTKYLISEWEQLQFVPPVQLDGITYGLCVCSIRYTNCICKTVSIIRSPESVEKQTLYTFIVETTKFNQNVILMDKQQVLNIINSFGFDINWTNSITLSVKEYDILCSLFRIGYNYVQRTRYSTSRDRTYLAVTENILSTYDSDFKWIILDDFISIPKILGLNTRKPYYDGQS